MKFLLVCAFLHGFALSAGALYTPQTPRRVKGHGPASEAGGRVRPRSNSPTRRGASARPPGVKLAHVIELSKEFPIKVSKNAYTAEFLLANGHSRDEVRYGFNSFRAIIHERALRLCIAFLELQHYNAHAPRPTLEEIVAFLSRLIRKRAIVFYTEGDTATILVREKSGELKVHHQSNNWGSIGTPAERHPFTREHCLTYEEVQLAALISFSGHTIFLNNGARNNNCVYEKIRSAIEQRGVIIGAVGPRFEKADVMDHRNVYAPVHLRPRTAVDDIFLDHYAHSGHTRHMIPLYRLDGPLWRESNPPTLARYTMNPEFAVKDAGIEGYARIEGYFDTRAYTERMILTIDAGLVDANDRARTLSNTAFIHMVGLGLGYWMLYAEQNDLYVEILFGRLAALAPVLQNVSDVRFAYIPSPRHERTTHIAHIQITFNQMNPSELVGMGLALVRKLLIVFFAYDGNALAGNEFWLGAFTASGDPAAACSSQIAETFNPYINPRVGARSLMVITARGQMVPIREYLIAF